MEAFNNKQETKDFYLARVKRHFELDEIIKGKYWENGKGCAVGCTIHSSNHADYESELGIPEWLARLEDTIFENLPNNLSKMWPIRFLESINTGADLEKVKTPFLIFILENCLKSMDACVYDEANNPYVKNAIEQSKSAVKEMIRLHREGLDLSAAWSAAASAAWSAASAAWSAASAAGSAVRSAASAAGSAVRSAASAAASAAGSAVRSAAFVDYSEKLLELMAAQPPQESKNE